MRAYLQGLPLLKAAGYLWGKLFLGNAVPGWLTALGSVHVQNTKAASVLDGWRRRHRQELRARQGQAAGHSGTAGLFWSARRAAACPRASAGIVVPRAKAEEGRQGLLRPGWKWWLGSKDHSPAFAGISPWPLRGTSQNSEVLAGSEIYQLEVLLSPGWRQRSTTTLVGLLCIFPLFSLPLPSLGLSSVTRCEIRQELCCSHQQSLLPDFHIQPCSFVLVKFSFPEFFAFGIV